MSRQSIRVALYQPPPMALAARTVSDDPRAPGAVLRAEPPDVTPRAVAAEAERNLQDTIG
jgi:hypothetical protein